ncbi:alpha-glucan family phosphorylase [Candidatus Peregrinibacteria bacterium]|nr:alpha-glucan family phosphorylase [Candidatus Peregrinibacteria bacterium]
MPKEIKTATSSNSVKIAYFSMEIALKSEMPNYAGGLGVLAADILKSCADLAAPVCGVSLMYHVSEDSQYAFKPGQEFKKRPETVQMHIEDRLVTIGVWEYVLQGEKGKVSVYFLDTNFPENKRWDRDITKDLYASDRYTRLCQEAILGIGGVRMLRELGLNDIETFHMNEGHAALLTLSLLKENEFIDEPVRKLCAFTTHTPVPAGHDHFDYKLVHQVLGQKVPWHIKKLAGNDDLNMTRLALSLSRKVNGVARKHAQVCNQMFPEYTFQAVTNGIHVKTWAGQSMAKLFDKELPGWVQDPGKLKEAVKLPDQALLEAHNTGKKVLIDHINNNPDFFPIPSAGLEDGDLFDMDTLTITFARRFVSYKRPLLIFNDLERLRDLGYEKLQLVFAGPYHPDNHYAMEILNQLSHYGHSLRGQVKVAICSDYNLATAQYLVRGTDVWLNNPQPPMEASGTSGMKAALNAALNLSILDGWWIEGYEQDPKSGWAFGQEPSAIIQPREDRVDADALYNALEDVIDCYYNRKDEWMERMKHAIALGAYFNTHRCVEEYMEKMWS